MSASGRLLGTADLALIHRVAARRRGGDAGDLDHERVARLLEELAEPDQPSSASPFARAARLSLGLTRLLPGGLGRQVALLVLVCQLRIDGYQLTAPQGVLAGMIEGADSGEPGALARWLEDRSLALPAPGDGAGW